MSSHTNQPQVRKRRVFYIPGYDPIPARRYRELYRTESQAQAEISGYEIAMSPKPVEGPFGWHVTSVQDGMEVQTDIDVLVWSDIVRDSMSGSILATYFQLGRTAWTYISTGTLKRLRQLRKGPVIAALYPVGMLLLQLAAAMIVVAVAVATLGWWGLLPSLALAYLLLQWFRKIDNRLFAYYLMHDYAYSAQLNGETPTGLQDRLDEFVHLIDAALDARMWMRFWSSATVRALIWACPFWPI